jgi:hypothetical protein
MSQHEHGVDTAQPATQVGWHSLLHDASTQEAVVALARDYIALWSPEELAHLALDLRPGKLVDADDVTLYALRLVRAQLAGEADHAVQKMAAFFGSASLRLSQILASS